MEDLLKLESDDTHASRDVASRIQHRLKGNRDPSLLGQLVDFYFQTYSKRARKILTTLRETHSQDFFDKLNECLWSQKILPVFKLLAHALNSQQTTWLYRIVDHPLFASIIQQLQESEDVMVLAMGVLVVAAILPLVPTYIGSHLQCLFSIFCDLATIRTTKRLGLTPHELLLHLDVSVYYLFLQLYALFPCNLFSYFKSHCENSTRAQVNAFQEYIAPLFYQVQLHPGLVTDSCAYELSKSKWGAMDPSAIATHSIQLCMDSLLAPSSPEAGQEGAEQTDSHVPPTRLDLLLTPTTPQLSSAAAPRPNSLNLAPSASATAPPPDHTPSASTLTAMATTPNSSTKQENHLSVEISQNQSTTFTLDEPPTTSEPPNPEGLKISGPPNPEGLKTSEEMCNFWSPSVSLGHMTVPNQQQQGQSATASHRSSGASVTHHSQLSLLYPSTLSSPNSDSAVSSVLHTPAPTYPPPGGASAATSGGSVFSYKNYSPTASVDSESLFSRGAVTQSAIHTPARMDESYNSASFPYDPLSQSLMVDSPLPRPPGASPTKSLRTQQHSLRNRLEKFLGVFRREEGREVPEEATASEEYIELFVSDAKARQSPTKDLSGETVREKSRSPETVPLAVTGRKSRNDALGSDVEDSGRLDSPVNSHRQSGLEGVGQLEALDNVEIDISTLPPVSNSSDSPTTTDSSRTSLQEYRHDNDSPNTAGAGHFECTDAGHSYKELGASATAEIARISSSYPNSTVLRVARAPGTHHRQGRRHTSTSETELGVHAHQLQEKLQRLIEDKEPTGSAQHSREGSIAESRTPVTEEHHQSQSLYPPGHTLLAMRRLSVCSRKGIGIRLTSESSNGVTVSTSSQTGTVSTSDPTPLLLNGHPSPLALLDQFVSCGEVLHRGNLDTIPLTEQEGVDWNHFGGCPHSEEFRIMQSQMVLLHSQLLFERYQCVQHAKRNRRLLSKARSAAHVTEELVSLRDQLHQQEALVSSLQQQLRKVFEGQSAKQQGCEGGGVALENTNLKDANAKLREELSRMEERNKRLEEELKCSSEKLCNLTSERQQLEPRLQLADQLQSEMSSLSARYHQLEEVHQRDQDQIVSLRSRARQGREWRAKCASLLREKGEGAKRINELEQALGACRSHLKELEVERSQKLLDLKRMQRQLEEERSHAISKIKALEEKYGSMKAIGQQLESHVMELKSRAPAHRKKMHPTRHRRNPSSTSSATNTPSPTLYLATPPPIAA